MLIWFCLNISQDIFQAVLKTWSLLSVGHVLNMIFLVNQYYCLWVFFFKQKKRECQSSFLFVFSWPFIHSIICIYKSRKRSVIYIRHWEQRRSFQSGGSFNKGGISDFLLVSTLMYAGTIEVGSFACVV